MNSMLILASVASLMAVCGSTRSSAISQTIPCIARLRESMSTPMPYSVPVFSQTPSRRSRLRLGVTAFLCGNRLLIQVETKI